MNTAASALTLNRLDPGESGTILSLEAGEELHQRLVALGLRIGDRVRLLRRARFGGPLHIRVGMTELIMRRREASRIHLAFEHPAD